MAILITGTEGMVGRNLTAHFRRNNINVVEFLGDCTQTRYWEEYVTEKFEAVIHLAAFAGVRPSMEKPEAYYYNNTRSTENFLKYGSKMSDKLLYASSSNAHEWWLNPYAATKKMNECQAHLMRPAVRAIGMRFHTVYPGRPDMLFRKLQNKEVTYINKDHYRDFVHIRDLCEAIHTIVNNYDKVYNDNDGVVDIGTGHAVPVSEVAKLMGYDGEYVEGKSVGERVHTAADIQYLLDLGWTPKRNILDVNCHTE